MALPFFIKQSTITAMDGMVLKIAKLKNQISTQTQSDTTDSLNHVLSLYEKMLVDLRNTYNSLSKGGIPYTRKYANASVTAPVTGAQYATHFIKNNIPSNSTDSSGQTSDTVKTYQLNYTIQQGDTLSGISKKTGISVEELCRVNNIKNPNLIKAGANMIIPMTLPSVIGSAMRLNSVNLTGGSTVTPSKDASQSKGSVSSANKSTPTSQPTVSDTVQTQPSTVQNVMSDQDKMNRVLKIKYDRQNSKEAATIPYPGGTKGDASTAQSSACGSYAVLHSMRYIGKDNQLDIRSICGIAVESGARPKSGGTNIGELVDALRQRGYDVSGYVTNNNDINAIGNGKAMICCFHSADIYNNTTSGGHFVSVVELSEDKSHALVIDSMQGGLSLQKTSKWDATGIYGDSTVDGIYWMPVEDLKKAYYKYLIS